MKQAVVLMSTYNGESYLRSQLDSILNQSYSNIKIIVRDDGSSDNTIKILKEYESERLNWYSGKNLKPAKSFMNLLINSPICDYYAFSDQDDFWYPDKINSAINRLELEDNTKPILYFSRKQITNDKLEKLGSGEDMYYEGISLGFSIMKCTVAGCTMVMNNALVEIIRKHNLPENFVMHDIWVLMVALSFGIVISEDKVLMDYRQHDNNFFGASKRSNLVLFNLIKLIKLHRNDRERSEMIREYIKIYGMEINNKDKKYLTYLTNLNFPNKMKCIFSKYYHGENMLHTILLKVLLLLGWI